MATDKIQTGLRIDAKTLSKLIVIAKRNRRSRNSQVEIWVQECIEKYEKEHGPIKVDDE